MKAGLTGIRSAAILTAILGGLLVPALARAAPEGAPLTNAKIVEMSKAHLSAQVIVEQIRSRPGKYALEADDLIKLKKAGVADEVILAMQRKAQGKDAGEPAAAGKGTAQGAQVYMLVPAPRPAKEEPMARVRDPVPVDGVWQRDGKSSWDPLTALNEFSRSLRGLRMVRHFQVGAQTGIVGVEAWCDLVGRGELDTMHLSYVVELPVGQPRKLAWNPWQKFGYRELSKFDREPWGELILKIKELDPGREGYWSSVPVKDHGRLIRTDKVFSSARANFGDHRLPSMNLMPAGSLVVELELDRVYDRVPIEIPTGDPNLRELAASCGIAAGYSALHEQAKKALPSASEQPRRRAPDGFVFGSEWNRLPRRMSVELDELAPQLARLMVRHGLSPYEYLPELEAVTAIARRCGELDRKAGSAPRKRLENGAEIEDLSGLGPEYAACQQPPSKFVNVSELVQSKARRQVWMNIVLRDNGDLWRKANRFKAVVGFYPLEGDTGVERGGDGNLVPEAMLDAYTIGWLTVWPKGFPKERTWHGLAVPEDPDSKGWQEFNGPPLSQ